jgi:hypothetical protein
MQFHARVPQAPRRLALGCGAHVVGILALFLQIGAADARDESGVYNVIQSGLRGIGAFSSEVDPAHVKKMRSLEEGRRFRGNGNGSILRSSPSGRQRAATSETPRRRRKEARAGAQGAGRALQRLYPHLLDGLGSVVSDPTLRRGDVVIFPAGPKIFVSRGRKPPWTAADFVDAASYDGFNEVGRIEILSLTLR